jgi:16S rRNA (guanine527-N7)-methyltransferase
VSGPLGQPSQGDEPLIGVLARARDVGFLGPGPLDAHLDQARRALSLVECPAGRCLDLGSGGGVPGLPLAWWCPESTWVLLESQQNRADRLRLSIGALGIDDRVSVDARRAEVAGRDPALRAAFDLVVARSFGPPAVTVECGAPFVRPGGLLIVAEPPDPDESRWPHDPLALLGIIDEGTHSGCRRLRLGVPFQDRYPRAVGRPARAPLFGGPDDPERST